MPMIERDQDHVALAAVGETGGIGHAAIGVAGIGIGGAQLRVELDGGPKQRVIEEMLAHRQIAFDREPHRLQLVRRTNA
jgi:hypothetical protein